MGREEVKEGGITRAGYHRGGARLRRGVLVREDVLAKEQSGDAHLPPVMSAHGVEDSPCGSPSPALQHLCPLRSILTILICNRFSLL